MTAADCMRLQGHSVVVCRCSRTPGVFLACPAEAIGNLTPTYPPIAYRKAHAELHAPPAAPPLRVYAGGAGYTGSICDMCGGTRMRRSGTCETCDDCGHAGGCG